MAIKFSNTFLLRKLHQLTGVVPLGVFFLVHMYTNSAAMNGAKSFNKHVLDIHDLPSRIVEIGRHSDLLSEPDGAFARLHRARMELGTLGHEATV